MKGEEGTEAGYQKWGKTPEVQCGSLKYRRKSLGGPERTCVCWRNGGKADVVVEVPDGGGGAGGAGVSGSWGRDAKDQGVRVDALHDY